MAKAVSYEEALDILMQRAVAGSEVLEVPLAEASGHVLAEDVLSDIDMPRFDKAAMDGYAYRHGDTVGSTSLKVVATIAAGDRPGDSIGSGECARIMTGAPIPTGADTLVPIEETSYVDPAGQSVAEDTAWVRFHAEPARGAHIAARGEDLRAGTVVLRTGHLIRHQSIAILASVGRTRVRVQAGPSIAFAATGEELIEPGLPLAPGKIYNSNALTLWSQILAAKGRPHYLGILRDQVEDLRTKIAAGLQHDMIVLSGGVSAGSFDYVPAMLTELGVECHFHKLMVKPGRPMLFGTRGRTLVFGLPGNPISTLYAFDLFVAPTIRVFRHHPHPQVIRYRGELTEAVRKPSGRLLFQPCRCEWNGESYLLTPIHTHGSADIYAVAEATALALIPAGVEVVEKGKPVGFRKLYED
jgi:molybdopterin molybdotransferase